MPKQNVPALRLEGFSGEWETGHFGDAGRELIGYPFESSEFSKDGVKLVRGMNIKRGSLDFSSRIDMRWPSTEGVEDYLLEEDDIVIAMDGLVGTSFAKIETCHLPALLVQRVFRMRPESADPSFVYQSIVKGFALHAQLLRTSTTIAHLTSRDISAFPVSYPPTLEEQQAIGAIFTNLDATINQHALKHKALQQAKTALMQRMFPQEGQTEPELRLEGFDGEWSEAALGDFGYAAMDKRVFKHQTSPTGDVPFYKIGTFGKSPDSYISWDLYREYTAKYVHPSPGTVLISASGSIGRTVVYDGSPAYFQDSNIIWLEHGEDISDTYLKHFYTVTDWGGIEGTTIKRLYNEQFLKTKIVIPPTLEEQQAIGAVFTNLDQLITAEAQYIESLKQAKTALLQRMFI